MKLIATLLTSLTLALSANATLFTNTVSVDSFVRSNSPAANYGGAGALSVSGLTATNVFGQTTNGITDTFIRFNTALSVSNFNAQFGTNNWVINGAKLRVTEVGAPNNSLFSRGIGAFEIRWVANTNWTEGTGMPMSPTANGIAFTNEFTLLNTNTDASLGVFTNAGVDSAQAFNLALPTEFTSSLRNGGEVGFFLTALDSGTGFTFNSKTFGTASARPFLDISALPQPAIVSLALTETDCIVSATNGFTNATYYLLSSSDLTLPLSQWTPISTNLPSTNGDFTITPTNALGTSDQLFFILQAQ